MYLYLNTYIYIYTYIHITLHYIALHSVTIQYNDSTFTRKPPSSPTQLLRDFEGI